MKINKTKSFNYKNYKMTIAQFRRQKLKSKMKKTKKNLIYLKILKFPN